MRIGIVNDLRLACEALRRVVQASPGHQVAWTASDGSEAVKLACSNPPDLILMDLVMPVMDGVEATRQVMSQAPCPIVVVTSSVSANISKVYDAMGFGALDAVDTPILGAGGQLEGASALLAKIATVERLMRRHDGCPPELRPAIAPVDKPPTPRPGTMPLILLGSSTGGPRVVAQILKALPTDFKAGVILVQHVDTAFAPGLAKWLAEQCQLPVELIMPGREPEPGRVLVAASAEHLVMARDGRLWYTPEPLACCFRPSVDVFFESVARTWPEPGIAALLTGMGRDGATGLLSLRRQKWFTMAQDKASSTVWGMPRAAVELGAALKVLRPVEISESIVSWMRMRQKP